jgi:hypothetical protein
MLLENFDKGKSLVFFIWIFQKQPNEKKNNFESEIIPIYIFLLVSRLSALVANQAPYSRSCTSLSQISDCNSCFKLWVGFRIRSSIGVKFSIFLFFFSKLIMHFFPHQVVIFESWESEILETEKKQCSKMSSKVHELTYLMLIKS